MKIKDTFLTSIAPLLLMAYGWYLGQLHQSGYDIAGIFLFISGLTALVLAFIIRKYTKRFSWNNTWYANTLTGVISCGIVFSIVLVIAKIHG